jgi:hypothetical protein
MVALWWALCVLLEPLLDACTDDCRKLLGLQKHHGATALVAGDASTMRMT